MVCRVCNSKIESGPILVKEMMFGFRTEHTYYECSNCEALVIETIPENLGQYYPDNYYSFNQQHPADIITKLLRKVKTMYNLHKKKRIHE